MNEMELYAGFQRNEESYLDKIFQRTQQIFENIHTKYQKVSVDAQLTLMVAEVFDISVPINHLGKKIKSYTLEQQDCKRRIS